MKILNFSFKWLKFAIFIIVKLSGRVFSKIMNKFEWEEGNKVMVIWVKSWAAIGSWCLHGRSISIAIYYTHLKLRMGPWILLDTISFILFYVLFVYGTIYFNEYCGRLDFHKLFMIQDYLMKPIKSRHSESFAYYWGVLEAELYSPEKYCDCISVINI